MVNMWKNRREAAKIFRDKNSIYIWKQKKHTALHVVRNGVHLEWIYDIELLAESFLL